MYFAIRVAVMSAIAFAFYLTRGFGSFVETFAMAFGASLASHALVGALRPRDREAKVASPYWFFDASLVALAAIAIAIAIVGFLALAPPHRTGPLERRFVDEVMASPASWIDEEVKLAGYVELGSMTLGARAREFVLTRNKQRVAVRFAGVAPDTLKDRAEVLARGRLVRGVDGAYVFEATDVAAKCPSTYQTANGPVPASTFR